MEQGDVGYLYSEKNIKFYRTHFKKSLDARGLKVLYYAPLSSNKKWDLHGELDTYFYRPIIVGCNFVEYVDQKTTKRMGWVAELNEGSSLIQVPYDVPNLQNGSLFVIPRGLDEIGLDNGETKKDNSPQNIKKDENGYRIVEWGDDELKRRSGGRVFRVISIQNAPIFPAYFTCEIAPVYQNDLDTSATFDFTDNTGNILVDGSPQAITRLRQKATEE